MTTWQVRREAADTDELSKALADGWEPFAVTEWPYIEYVTINNVSVPVTRWIATMYHLRKVSA